MFIGWDTIKKGQKMRVRIGENGYKPVRAHIDDAGADLRSPLRYVVKAHKSVVIDTEVAFEIPVGYCGFVRSRSGLMMKAHILAPDGTVDSSYRGSVNIMIENHGDEDYTIERGDRIAQIVFVPCLCCGFEEADELSEGATNRGENGFGSSGR